MNENAGSKRSSQSKIKWLVAFLLFVAVLMTAPRFAQNLSNPIVRIAVMLSPMFFYVTAIFLQVRRSDEFVRKITLEQIAISAAVTVGFGITYAVMEQEGYPKLSAIWVLPMMTSVWAFLAVVERIRHR